MKFDCLIKKCESYSFVIDQRLALQNKLDGHTEKFSSKRMQGVCLHDFDVVYVRIEYSVPFRFTENMEISSVLQR